MKEAMFQKKLEDSWVQCLLCPHLCLLKNGQRGICRTRENRDGTLFTLAYGNPCSVAVDPIEKKPLFHFFPGSRILSIATAGCNFRCLNCQNWEISQVGPDNETSRELTPEAIIQLALQQRTESIAFTYTEPTVFYEYMLDIARLAKASGLKTVLISNGYIQQEPLEELCKYLDAANIDLKSMNDAVYHSLTGGRLQPVLDTLCALKDRKIWLEITHLLIPGYTDEPSDIEDLCEGLVERGFSDTPLHFSRFFPRYKLMETPETPEKALLRAGQISGTAGMNYVYLGNMPGLHGENTFCPVCKRTVIERRGYQILNYQLDNNRCKYCGSSVLGIFA
jgi:pyruvate formate lyase activating enzyme